MRPLLTSTTLLLVLVAGAGREAQASAIYWTEHGGAISGANADGTGLRRLSPDSSSRGASRWT
jgi:hypothetical protein